MECYLKIGEKHDNAKARYARLLYKKSGLLSLGKRREAVAILKELVPYSNDILSELGIK